MSKAERPRAKASGPAPGASTSIPVAQGAKSKTDDPAAKTAGPPAPLALSTRELIVPVGESRTVRVEHVNFPLPRELGGLRLEA